MQSSSDCCASIFSAHRNRLGGGQTNPPEVCKDTLTLDVYFRQDIDVLDTTYMGNRATLDSLSSVITGHLSAGTLQHIELKAYASPEGTENRNRHLAAARTLEIANWIMESCGVPSDLITHTSGGVGWGILKSMLREHKPYYKDTVIDIIDNVPFWVFDNKGRIIGGRKHTLMNLEAGNVWRDMEARFYPEIRCCHTIVISSVIIPPPAPEPVIVPEVIPEPEPEPVDTVVVVPVVPVVVPEPVVAEEPADPSALMAIKTNLLEDAVLIPNIGVEFHLGKGWSLGLNWEYAWWHSDRVHWYWRAYGGDLTLRKYFGDRSRNGLLRGHHLGLYGQIYTYDFELGAMGIIGGVPGGTIFDRFNYGGGLEYGYSFRIAKSLNLDLSLGLGYSGGQFHEYVPIDGCYVWQTTKNRHYWGPTKAEVSLVWLLGADRNKKEGR